MNEEKSLLINNLIEVRKKVEAAAAKSGRNADDIRIIAVTKTIDIDRVSQVVSAGVTDLGENKVQELLEKYDNIDRKCSWHLIGHLQTNKVKYIIDKVSLIHSVDSMELVREIDRRAKKAERKVDILIQVNVSGEETKFGIPPDKTMEFVREAGAFTNVIVRGLMTIAPHVENPEEARYVFSALKKIFIDIKKENIDNIYMDYLSMGMSNDYEVAIEEGANLIRIGTAIFGKRNYV